MSHGNNSQVIVELYEYEEKYYDSEYDEYDESQGQVPNELSSQVPNEVEPHELLEPVNVLNDIPNEEPEESQTVKVEESRTQVDQMVDVKSDKDKQETLTETLKSLDLLGNELEK